MIIGNAAGGKSTLACQISARLGLPIKLLWQEGWRLAARDVYEAQHSAAIIRDQWIVEGLGVQASSIPLAWQEQQKLS